jgi:hypothetical protein
VGIAGTDAFGPATGAFGDAFVMGTAVQALTPRLPISVESSRIPARLLGVTDDAEVGADDEATLLEPAPHMPDNPAAAAIPEVVDNPEVAEIPDAAPGPDVAVAGGAVPFSVTPPPS